MTRDLLFSDAMLPTQHRRVDTNAGPEAEQARALMFFQ